MLLSVLFFFNRETSQATGVSASICFFYKVRQSAESSKCLSAVVLLYPKTAHFLGLPYVRQPQGKLSSLSSSFHRLCWAWKYEIEKSNWAASANLSDSSWSPGKGPVKSVGVVEQLRATLEKKTGSKASSRGRRVFIDISNSVGTFFLKLWLITETLEKVKWSRAWM